jgi:hypothetical protein
MWVALVCEGWVVFQGVRSGRKEEAAQRGVQSAGGDGDAFGGEDPGGAVGGVWGSFDDDQQLEAGAGDACGGAVRRGSKAPAAADAQKVIDDLHRKIGSCRSSAIFLPGSPPSPDCWEAGDDCAGSGTVRKAGNARCSGLRALPGITEPKIWSLFSRVIPRKSPHPIPSGRFSRRAGT